MAEARVAAMSMYSELLAMSVTIDDSAADPALPTEKRLLDELAAQRDRLEVEKAISPDRRSDAPTRVASELQYDRTLLKLCRMHGIDCDVARFRQPARERRRLEQALQAAGVDLRRGRHHGQRRRPDHEPPDGS